MRMEFFDIRAYVTHRAPSMKRLIIVTVFEIWQFHKQFVTFCHRECMGKASSVETGFD